MYIERSFNDFSSIFHPFFPAARSFTTRFSHIFAPRLHDTVGFHLETNNSVTIKVIASQSANPSNHRTVGNLHLIQLSWSWEQGWSGIWAETSDGCRCSTWSSNTMHHVLQCMYGMCPRNILIGHLLFFWTPIGKPFMYLWVNHGKYQLILRVMLLQAENFSWMLCRWTSFFATKLVPTKLGVTQQPLLRSRPSSFTVAAAGSHVATLVIFEKH